MLNFQNVVPLFYALVTSVATLTGGALSMYTRLRLVELPLVVGIHRSDRWQVPEIV